ncbi:MAG: transposase [Bacteroidota bacterium]
MEKYKGKYRNESTRLRNRDYGAPGFYFVTLCTKDREHYFGEIAIETEDSVRTQDLASVQTCPHVSYTEIGKIACKYWLEIPAHFPFVVPDEFIVMPDHVHGILHFDKPDYRVWKKSEFGPQSQNLASVVRGYKAAVKKYATMNKIEFLWQPRYYDHIIRTDTHLNNIRNYIKRNPEKWAKDRDRVETQDFASQLRDGDLRRK